MQKTLRTSQYGTQSVKTQLDNTDQHQKYALSEHMCIQTKMFIYREFCFRQIHILFIYFRSRKPEPIDKDVYMVRQYTQTSLGAPKPLSFREATFTSSKDTNGLLRQSTNYSMFDVEV